MTCGADETGVIREVDVFVVDVLPKAGGLTIDDLRAYIRRVPRGAGMINVQDLQS